jgi:hypothetical protein
MLTASPPAALRFGLGYLGRYLLLLLPLAALYTRLWNASGESLLLVVVFHAFYNVTITVATSAWPDFPLGILVALLWVLAAGVLAGRQRAVGVPAHRPQAGWQG